MRQRSAFTLIELIIVITILAILATIAFFSFSGYSTSARDSVRLSDITNLANALEMTLLKAGSIPQPGASVALKASGGATTIGYQGFADSRILSYIGMSETKDALDGVYYTYVADANLMKYQVFGFLENANTLTLNSNIAESAYADTNDYSKRYPITKGKTLGIILKSDTKIPIQQIPTPPTTLDTSSGTTSSGYTIQFTNTEAITMTGGSTLISSMAIYQPKTLSILDSSLIGYWDMETLAGTKLKDLSGYGNDETCYSGTTIVSCNQSGQGGPQIVNSDKATGKAMLFNGSGAYLLSNTMSGFIDSAGTVRVRAKINSFPSSGSFLCSSNLNYRTYISLNAFGQVFATKGQPAVATNGYLLNTQDYYDFVVKWTGNKMYFYINGVLTDTKDFTSSAVNTNLSFGAHVGGTGFLAGIIDEARFYNRALSDPEIQSLYNTTK